MYQLEGVKNDSAVSELFSKHFPQGVSKLGSNMFLPLDNAPDFCKLVGFSSQQSASKLEQIASFISQEGYDKKADKFQKQCDKMKHKLICAKKAAKPSAPTTAAGGMAGFTSVTSIGDIVAQAEKMKEAECTNSKVAKAQNKLDCYIEKNKTLHESAQYTTAGKAAGGLISFEGSTSSGKNIHDEIEAEKKAAAAFVDASMKNLTNFLEEVFKHATQISMMVITDGNKTGTTNVVRNVKLDQLTAEKLTNAQNREMFNITK
jgi:cytochrome b involved in lipid metabolism